MRTLLLVPVLLPLVAPPANAQWLPAPFPTLKDQAPPAHQAVYAARRPGNPVVTVVGGVLGGMAGLLGGGYLGAGMEGDCHCDDPGLMGAVYGGLIGEGLGLALGAHLGDGLRGNLALDLLASVGGAAAGMAIASAANNGAVLIPAAALQMVLVAAAELGSARSKARSQ